MHDVHTSRSVVVTSYMYVYIYVLTKSDILSRNSLVVKKCEANLKQVTETSDIKEGQEDKTFVFLIY